MSETEANLNESVREFQKLYPTGCWLSSRINAGLIVRAYLSQTERVKALEEALRISLAFIEDSVDGAIGYGRDDVFVKGVSDMELKPDGSYLLSHARAALSQGVEG